MIKLMDAIQSKWTYRSVDVTALEQSGGTRLLIDVPSGT